MTGWRKTGKRLFTEEPLSQSGFVSGFSLKFNHREVKLDFLSLQCEHTQERNRDKITEKVFVSLKCFTCKIAEKNNNTNRELSSDWRNK